MDATSDPSIDSATVERITRLTSSPLFPFEGDHRLRTLGEPMAHELVRDGESPDRPCHSCGRDERVLWRDDRWKITPLAPSANPVGLFLETVEHLDLEDFDDRMAAEYGVLTRHLVRAIDALDSVGRVHVHRWGDGSSHFHVWFQGRPARQLELYGWGNVLWAQLLPALPAEVVTANHAQVVAAFARTAGGTVTG